jgi:hypothetical protein
VNRGSRRQSGAFAVFGRCFALATADADTAAMKRLVLATSLALASTSCYGSYGAFNKIHDWNGKATNSKIANSAIHLGLWILPLYELCIIGDFLIFNNIEFITGDPVFK